MDDYESLSHSKWECEYHVSSQHPSVDLIGHTNECPMRPQ
jgi:hypothetical protein